MGCILLSSRVHRVPVIGCIGCGHIFNYGEKVEMSNRIVMALAVLLVSIPLAFAEDKTLEIYGIHSGEVEGVGVGISGLDWRGADGYIGIEVDRAKSDEQGMGDENTVALAVGLNSNLAENLSWTVYGLLGVSRSDSCDGFGCVEDDNNLNPGAGARLTWVPKGDGIGLTAGVRMTERSEVAVTAGVSW